LSAFVKVLNTFLSLLVGILLARLLGAAEYGSYQFTLSWIALLSTVAGFGLKSVIERELAAHVGKLAWPRVKGVIRFGYLSTAVTSVLLAIMVMMVLKWLPGGQASLLWIAALLLPIQAITGVGGVIQLGFKNVVYTSLPQLLQMIVFAALLGIIWFLLSSDQSVGAATALYLNLLTAVFGLALSLVLVQSTLKTCRDQLRPVQAEYAAGSWLRAGLPLMLISGMLTINNQADILMLGLLADAEATGVYHAATRMANFLTFALGAMIVPMRPLMSEFHASGQSPRLQRVVTRAIRLIFAASLPLAAVFILFGGPLLGWLYGDSFRAGAVALALLSLAQLTNIAAGPVQALLVMCGHEKVAAWGVAVSTLVNVVLNAILIPLFGIEGAAVATGLSIIAWNLLLIWETERRLGLRPTILGAALSLQRRSGVHADARSTRQT